MTRRNKIGLLIVGVALLGIALTNESFRERVVAFNDFVHDLGGVNQFISVPIKAETTASSIPSGSDVIITKQIIVTNIDKDPITITGVRVNDRPECDLPYPPLPTTGNAMLDGLTQAIFDGSFSQATAIQKGQRLTINVQSMIQEGALVVTIRGCNVGEILNATIKTDRGDYAFKWE